MRFAFIGTEKARFPASRRCGALGVSQSGFFAWKSRPAGRHQRGDTVYKANIRAAFELSNGTYDSPGMHRDMLDGGHVIRRRRVSRSMRENKLIARQKRRFKRTADSQYAWPVAPNLVGHDFEAEKPDRKLAVNRRRMLTPCRRAILPPCRDDAGRARGPLESARDRPGADVEVMPGS